MNSIKHFALLLFCASILISCNQPANAKHDTPISEYKDIEKFESPAYKFAGTYKGKATMSMDPSKPGNEYPGTFTVEAITADTVKITASIKPGKMPFPVNYRLKKPSKLVYSKKGYLITGEFTVSVTMNSGEEVTMDEFYFNLNPRSCISIDKNKQYCLRMWYPDNNMQSGKILEGDVFFFGKKTD